LLSLSSILSLLLLLSSISLSRLGTHYLCRSSEGLDDGLELEVIDEEQEVGDGEASKAKDDGSEVS
jgi:hypothetical protein